MSGRQMTMAVVLNLFASAVFALILLGLGELDAARAAFLAVGLIIGTVVASILFAAPAVGDPTAADLEVGIQTTNASPNEQVESMLDGANHAIDFWGVSANRTGRSVDAQKAMQRVGNNGGQIRFLLLDPDSPHLARRAADEKEDAESWRTEIRSTVTRLRSHAQNHGYEISIRYFDAYPIWRLVSIDRRSTTLNWFLPGKPGHHSPYITLSSESPVGLFVAFRREFEEAWQNARTA